MQKVFGFSKAKRLNTPSDFRAVFKNPLRSGSPCFTVLASPNGREVSRLGVVVAKRYIRLAVTRNWIKRKIRENFRLYQDKLLGLDIVVLVRCTTIELKRASNLTEILCQQWAEIGKKWKNVCAG